MNEPSFDHLLDTQIDEHYKEEDEVENEAEPDFYDYDDDRDYDTEGAERDMAYGSYDHYQRMP